MNRNGELISILDRDENIQIYIKKILEIDIKRSREIERDLRRFRRERQQEKERKRTIPYWYEKLIDKLNEYLKEISISNLNLEDFLKPEGISEAIAKGLQFKRTQLRKFFNEIKRIKLELKNKDNTNKVIISLVSIIPKLAYSKGRGLVDEKFYEFIKILVMKLREDLTDENFKKFEQIFESIIAYHTYYHRED